jgi:polar amino acid transport system substrate-binding protein
MVATEFPPYTGSRLPGGGLASVITRDALALSGLPMQLQFRPWSRAITEFSQGEYDGLIGAWFSAERQQTMLFAREMIISNRIGFMALAGTNIRVDDLLALTKLRIGTVRGYANPERFEQAHLRVDEASDDLGNLRKLLQGRVDLALIDKGVAFFLMDSDLKSARARLQWLEPAVSEQPLYTVLAKGQPQSESLLAALNHGIDQLQGSGQLARLLRDRAQWF